LISLVDLPRLGLLILAWLIADLMAPVLIRLSHRVGAVDVPQGYKGHARPIPFLGGLAILLGFSAAIAATLRFESIEQNPGIFGILLGGCFVSFFGTLDDFRPLNAVLKLGVLLLATYLLSIFGVRISLTGNAWADLALTLLWVAGVTSAMNSLDNMDGAVGGTAAIAAFFAFLVGFYGPVPERQPGVSYVALALMGGCLGFLRYNWNPARIFLGNNGAFLLGFLLASLMVLTGWSRDDPIKAAIIPCAILVVPLYDITLTTLLRIRAGVVRSPIAAITYCGRDHLSHRLRKQFGLSVGGAAAVLYAMGLLGGLAGFEMARPESGPAVYLPLTLAAVVGLVVLGALLERAPVYSALERARARGVPPDLSALARDIHFSSIVVDGHSDTIGRILDKGEDITARTLGGHLDLPRMLDGNLGAQFFACFVPPRHVETKDCALRVLRMMDALRELIRRDPRLGLATTAAQVRELNARGRLAAILCIEGGHAIENDLGLLRQFAALGARYMTLTWNNANDWADASREPPRHNGLTDFGRRVVQTMNACGMMVDLSHVSDKTFADAMETTTAPVIVSHSSCRALCDHVRNLTDDQLRAVARNGGVACINFYSAFIDDEFRKRAEGLDEAAQRLLPRPPFESIVRHIDHAVRVAGIDHVGLGADWDGVASLPEGMDDCAALPKLTEALLKRGYGDQDVRKILGENLLRVMEEAVDKRLA
jgi:membrane dipeptidase